MTIDLNSDLGESLESLANGTDYQIMRHITSANVACGGHAGDAHTMRQTLLWAKELGVAVGAHPSYPDRTNFGRRELALPPDEIEPAVREQIATLCDVAREIGLSVTHVKAHGALYHACSAKAAIAQAVGRAALAIDPGMVMYAQAGAAAIDTWKQMGLRCAGEAFADRAYEQDGRLRDRRLAGALLDPAQAAAQAVDIALRRGVLLTDGTMLPLTADTICIHSDTPGAVAIASEVNRRLKAAGIEVNSLVP